MSVKISKGNSPIEQRAIDAKLEQLGVTIDPATREVNDAGAQGSKVKGGLKGLERAAGATGDPHVLDQTDLTAIPQKFSMSTAKQTVQRLRGKDDETVAKATIAATAMAFRGTAGALSQFCDNAMSAGSFNTQELESVLRRMNKLATDIEGATKKDVVAHASTGELRDLHKAMGEYLDAFSKNADVFEKIVNKEFLPQAKKLADHHNSQGVWGRIASGLPVQNLQAIFDHLGDFHTSFSRILTASKLFTPHVD